MTAEPLPCERLIGRIPVRNIWLLMLYASDLTRFQDEFKALADREMGELPDLLARILVKTVEHRLRRNLTRGYRHRETAVTRVRGRIDILTTESLGLLSRGQIFCRFEELTINTPRNRLVRAALDLLSRLVIDKELANQCRVLASSFASAGVGGVRPSRADLASDKIGRNDSADRLMVALAQLAFDLALPTEESGPTTLVSPNREGNWVRQLFEKAVLGFCSVELKPLGWRVSGGIRLNWQVTSSSAGLASILPGMVTDIILDPPTGQRLIIDTKFASILTGSQFRSDILKSGYLYQMYAYVRSQEGKAPCWDGAGGLFLHPAVDANIREHAVIQNHPITFATVNLAGTSTEIRNELRGLFVAAESAGAGKR